NLELGLLFGNQIGAASPLVLLDAVAPSLDLPREHIELFALSQRSRGKRLQRLLLELLDALDRYVECLSCLVQQAVAFALAGENAHCLGLLWRPTLDRFGVEVPLVGRRLHRRRNKRVLQACQQQADSITANGLTR